MLLAPSADIEYAVVAPPKAFAEAYPDGGTQSPAFRVGFHCRPGHRGSREHCVAACAAAMDPGRRSRDGLLGVGLATGRIWLFSRSSFDRGLRLTCSPWRIGVCGGVEHQLAPGERCIHREVACRLPGPTRRSLDRVPYPARGCALGSPLAMVVTAPRMRLTPSLLSGPDLVEGSSPSESCAARASLGRSDLSSNGWPRSVSTTLPVLSISSLALPPSVGSSLIARLMRSKPSRMAAVRASRRIRSTAADQLA